MLFQQFTKTATRPLTYISLFSSAGVGCYGFKKQGYECIATNEIVARRLDVQKYNSKCKYESGYICGDITETETKEAIREQIALWKVWEELDNVDVVIATPPCQGMSVANHKKTSTEIVRNSLVVESIKIVLEIKPKIFIFENVPAFMKTVCTDTDGEEKSIMMAIQRNLGKYYSYASEVINFKDYGACSSRSRTLVIGVRRDLADEISPFELFPRRRKEQTLRQAIGKYPSLKEMGEISDEDIYHSFRPYPIHMREWIKDLREGECAFDQADEMKRPHQIVNGVRIENIRKNSDKYRRQFWDKVGPCVHTRNDQLASQNTIHPTDDRVFSIRELMTMMTVPDDFRWGRYSLNDLNDFSEAEKRAYLKKEEIKIRQSLGEAVPTVIFADIASQLKNMLSKRCITIREACGIVAKKKLLNKEDIIEFIQKNSDSISLSSMMRIAEYANTKRTENSAYYTNKSIVTEILKRIPDKTGQTIRILEPSVGVGCFIPLIAKRFGLCEVYIDVVDVDADSLEIFELLLSKMEIPKNVHVRTIHHDFLLYCFDKKYDYVIGNPPYGKYRGDGLRLRQYMQNARNRKTKNVFSFFLDKCYALAEIIALVLPKAVLNAPEFIDTREYLSTGRIHSVLDFGENGFAGVLVETIALICAPGKSPAKTVVYNMSQERELQQLQAYITDGKYPYWLLYRNDFFDQIARKLRFDCFNVYRDRQVTNSLLKIGNREGIRVLKSRNISNDGKEISNIDCYDAYIKECDAKSLSVYRYLNADSVYMTPNMTYNPRVCIKPKGVLVNGSIALLFPKNGIIPTDEQLEYFASDEYRSFYRIARNYQTRSLNVDACSVFFFGLKMK